MNRIRILIFACVSLEAIANPAAAQEPDAIAAQVFLGQVYPSGNVYLKPFPLPDVSQSEMDYLASFSWPETIFFQALSSTDPSAKEIREGRFSNVMDDGLREVAPNQFQMQTAYIPALESMDQDWHDGCTRELYRPYNPEYRYLGRDFFSAVYLHCEPNEGVAVYSGPPLGDVSFTVVAFDSDLALTEVTHLEGTPRPLGDDEAAAVERQKAEYEGESCTTQARFLDAATSHISARLPGTDLSILISEYQTPGCYGHLANVFVLDVLKAGALLKSYRLVQNKGAL